MMQLHSTDSFTFEFTLFCYHLFSLLQHRVCGAQWSIYILEEEELNTVTVGRSVIWICDAVGKSELPLVGSRRQNLPFSIRTGRKIRWIRSRRQWHRAGDGILSVVLVLVSANKDCILQNMLLNYCLPTNSIVVVNRQTVSKTCGPFVGISRYFYTKFKRKQATYFRRYFVVQKYQRTSKASPRFECHHFGDLAKADLWFMLEDWMGHWPGSVQWAAQGSQCHWSVQDSGVQVLIGRNQQRV